MPEIGDLVKGRRSADDAEWTQGELIIVDARGKMYVKDAKGVVFEAHSVIVMKRSGGKLYSPPKQIIWMSPRGAVHPHRRLPRVPIGLIGRSTMGKLRAVLEFRRRNSYRVAMAAVEPATTEATTTGEAEFLAATSAATTAEFIAAARATSPPP